ncbi:MAG: hypothetical protein RL086_491 [Bacteroidota bacterium]|jgi:hypothetical protein
MNTNEARTKVKVQLPPLPETLTQKLTEVYNTFNVIPKQEDTWLKETWPLYVVFGESGDYYPPIIELIKKWNELSTKIDSEIDLFKSDDLMLKSLEKDDLFYFYNNKKIYFEEISGKIHGETLEKINGKPTSFIHQDIKTFYTKFNKSIYASKDKSKENTGDAVLLYNCSPGEVYVAVTEGRVQGTPESLCEIIDENSKPTGKKFAMVSLKAGEGRIGKVTKFLSSKIDIPSATPSVRNPQALGPEDFITQNEIFNDIFVDKQILNEVEFFNALRSSLSRIVSKVGTLPKIVKDLWDDFTRRVKSLTTKLYGTLTQSIAVDVQQVKNELSTLISLQEKIENEVALNEALGPVEINHTLYINVKSFVYEVEKINFHSLFADVVQKSTELNSRNIFQVDIEGIDESTIQDIKNTIVNDIWKNNFYNKLQNQKCTLKKTPCNPAAYIERDAFAPMLWFNSNIIAVKFFQSFLNRIITQSGGFSDQKRVRDEFIKISAQISAEAIFGKNEGLPLIKFTGKKIERLGKKTEYSTGQSLSEKDKDFKLGRFHIKKSDDGNYFIIYMYILFDIKVEDDQVVPYYSLIDLRNVSGSSFTFKVEINKSNLSKDQVFK